ncbi:hypothetical protein FRB90_011228 [Tulasnella sp. 427]|nr:hypothetical protein FRB90_011228 [Tulasnella sp. 427]
MQRPVSPHVDLPDRVGARPPTSPGSAEIRSARERQTRRVQECLARLGRLTSMEANTSIDNVKGFTYKTHGWKDGAITPALARGLMDSDAKMVFRTPHTLCLAADVVVVDADGTCGYVVGVPFPAAERLPLSHTVWREGLVLPSLDSTTALLVQQPNMEFDFLGWVTALQVDLEALSADEVKSVYEERYPELVEDAVGFACRPFFFTRSARSQLPAIECLDTMLRGVHDDFLDGIAKDDMKYNQFAWDHDGWTHPRGSDVPPPRLRSIRNSQHSSRPLQIIRPRYQGLSLTPFPQATGTVPARAHAPVTRHPSKGKGRAIPAIEPHASRSSHENDLPAAADQRRIVLNDDVSGPSNQSIGSKRQRQSPPKGASTSATTPPRDGKRARLVGVMANLLKRSPDRSSSVHRRHRLEPSDDTATSQPVSSSSRGARGLVAGSARYIKRVLSGSAVSPSSVRSRFLTIRSSLPIIVVLSVRIRHGGVAGLTVATVIRSNNPVEANSPSKTEYAAATPVVGNPGPSRANGAQTRQLAKEEEDDFDVPLPSVKREEDY